MGRFARGAWKVGAWAAGWAWHAATSAAGAGAPAEDQWTYHVEAGDTLIGISRELLDDPARWAAVQRLNHVANPRHLQPGSSLRFPSAWVRREGTPATLVFVQGDVTLEHAGTGPQPAEAGRSVDPGDVLATGAEAAATLRFADGSRMLVPGGTRLQVGALEAIGRARRPHVEVKLQRGEADLQVSPAGKGPPAYTVGTPAVNLGVRGTEFRARHSPEQGQSQAEVTGGVVQATGAKGAGVSLQAGYGLAVNSDGATSGPVHLLAAPDLREVPARLERVPLRLQWPAVPGAAGYRAQVLAGGADDLLLDAAPRDPSAKWADLPDGAYRLRVRAVDARGLEGADSDHPFVLKARPEPPLLLEPRADAKSHGAQARFRWAVTVDPPRRYRLQVSETPGFEQPQVDRADLAGPSEDVPLAPGHWWWRMRSVNPGDDTGPFGEAQAFDQREMPEPPAVGASTKDDRGLVFSWGALQPGQKVQYQVARDAGFTDLVDDQTTTASEGILARPAPGRYFLRARTIDADGFEGPFGAAQQVDVPASRWWLLIPLGFLLWGL